MTSYERQISSGAERRPYSRTANSPTTFVRDSPSLKSKESPSSYNGVEGARKKGQVVERTSLEEANGATPVKPFLSSNVTPRSGSRRIRAETSSPIQSPRSNDPRSSPRSTLSVDRRLAPEHTLRNGSDVAYESPHSAQNHEPNESLPIGPEPTFTFKSPSSQQTDTACSTSLKDDRSKFFHADEIQPTKHSRPASVTGASRRWQQGHNAEDKPSGRSSAMSNGSAVPNEQQSAFCYAGDSPQIKSPPQSRAMGAPSTRPTLQTIHSQQVPAAISPVRDPSPLREEILPRRSSLTNGSPRKHKRLSFGSGIGMQSTNITLPTSRSVSRRSSLNSPSSKRDSTRARASSIHALNSPYTQDESSKAIDDGFLERSSAALSPGQGNYTPHKLCLPNKSDMTLTTPLRSQPQSPTKPPQSRIDHMNELATNARRERKVMDLEISNSSLLAINQTLEREMRKHRAELRRYRRLDKTGRLSTAPSSRSVSGKLSMLSDGISKLDLDSISSSDDSDDDSLGIDDSSACMTSIGSRPSSPTSRVPTLKFRDVKVLPLDLSAQRSLLEGSHKLNQSITHCLRQAETLLSSAKRALEREPSENDSLGPRVLCTDELEGDIDNGRQGLLSPVLGDLKDGDNAWEWSLAYNVHSPGTTETPFESASMLLQHNSQDISKAEEPIRNNHGNRAPQHSNEKSLPKLMTDASNNGVIKDNVSELSESVSEPPRAYSEDAPEMAMPFEQSPPVDYNSSRTHRPVTIGHLISQEALLQQTVPIIDQVGRSSSLPSIEQLHDPTKPGAIDDMQASSIDPSLMKTQPGVSQPSDPPAEDAILPLKSENEDGLQEQNANPDTPGNRNSLQNIGNYLSSWSRYAAGIRPP